MLGFCQSLAHFVDQHIVMKQSNRIQSREHQSSIDSGATGIGSLAHRAHRVGRERRRTADWNRGEPGRPGGVCGVGGDADSELRGDG